MCHSFLRLSILCVGVWVLCSCAHKPTSVPSSMNQGLQSSVTGTILDADVLAEGGDLALVPFKAGAYAEATDELDRLSLMIIKGIKDSIDSQKKSLRVVDPAETQPRLALQGYIQEFSKTGKLKRMMLKANQNSIVVEGEVWLISNGQRLLNFVTDKKYNPKKQKSSKVAYELGKEIGDYLGSYVK